MIRLHDICKSYRVGDRRRVILDHLNVDFRPGVNVGILGRNGAGKSTLMNIIGGAAFPDSGRVERTSSISWPIGFKGGFSEHLTGRENLRFVSRIYGADIKEVTGFVEEFSELGDYMDVPVKNYSSGMKAKLAFGLSMAIGFDFYLIDELTAVGDASFRAKSKQVFEERKATSTLIVVSHSISTIEAHCDVVGLLDKGKLVFYKDMFRAIVDYERLCQEANEMQFDSTETTHENDSLHSTV